MKNWWCLFFTLNLFVALRADYECGFENDQGACVYFKKCPKQAIKNLNFVAPESGNAYKTPKRCEKATFVCCEKSAVPRDSSSTEAPSYRPDYLTLPPCKAAETLGTVGSGAPCNSGDKVGICDVNCPENRRIDGGRCRVCESCCKKESLNRCPGECKEVCEVGWSERITATTPATTENYGEFLIEPKVTIEEPLCVKRADRCCIPPNRGLTTDNKVHLCGRYNPLSIVNKIGGGVDADFAEFPWLVVVTYKIKLNETVSASVFQTSGSLISPTVVLTAAHTVFELEDLKSYTVRVGEYDVAHNLEPIPSEEIPIKRIIIHENFHKPTHLNNIALIILERPVELGNSIGYVCLPPNVSDVDMESGCLIAGWGRNSSEHVPMSSFSTILKKAEVKLVERENCQERLRRTKLGIDFKLHESFICAIGENGEDTCKGDGGTPLVCPLKSDRSRYFQMGITSWGIGCNTKEIPGVYVGVSFFNDWIYNQINQLGESIEEK